MRGCLVTLGLLVVVVATAAWLLLPPVAGTLAQGALVAAGFNADAMTVTVTSDPPPRLLTLRADEVHVVASNARYQGIKAAGVDITLRDVRLVDRTFARLVGSLDLVTIAGSPGAPNITIPHVGLDGTANKVQATFTLPADTVEELVASELVNAIGIAPSRVVLTAPDRVTIEAGGVQIEARLALGKDGSLMLLPPTGAPLDAVTILAPDADTPYTIESFTIADGDLIVVATLEPDLG